MLSKILQTLFPKSCFYCGSIEFLESWTCSACTHYFEEINTDAMCKKCSYPLYFEQDDKVCGNCSRINFAFTFSRSIYIYNEMLRKVITAIKYGDETYQVPAIADCFYAFLLKHQVNFDIIAAVPMCEEDLVARKYNQSALFGLYLSKYYKNQKLFLPDLLIKTQKTKKLTSLTAAERVSFNHHFILNDEFETLLHGKNILIVDDVMTTGSTLHACAAAIKRKIPNSNIYCLTFARTVL